MLVAFFSDLQIFLPGHQNPRKRGFSALGRPQQHDIGQKRGLDEPQESLDRQRSTALMVVVDVLGLSDHLLAVSEASLVQGECLLTDFPKCDRM